MAGSITLTTDGGTAANPLSLSIEPGALTLEGQTIGVNAGGDFVGDVADTDFESNSSLPFYSNSVYIYSRFGNTALSTTSAYSGSRSCSFPYAAGQNQSHELGYSLNDEYFDLWFSYWLWIPTSYYHDSSTGTAAASNNKWFYVWGGDYGTPSTPGCGPNMWYQGGGYSYLKTYIWGTDYGDLHFDDRYDNAIGSADIGEWTKWIYHYKLNSGPSTYDGHLRCWKVRNGTEYAISEITNSNMLYRTGMTGWTQGYILGWANGIWPDPLTFYLDDFKISTTSLR